MALLSIAALVLLAASVPDLEFSQGYRLGARREGGRLSLNLADDVLDTLISALLMIAPILMLAGVVYALRASGFRARALLWFLWVALMLAGLYVAMRLYPAVFQRFPRITGPPDPAMVTPLPAVTSVPGELGEFTATVPEWAEPVVAIGVALFVALGIVAGTWALVHWLQRRASTIAATPEALASEAQRALDALRAGADVRDTVMRCYLEMGRVLDEHYGLVRREAMTPREFERLLVGVAPHGRPLWVLPRAEVEQLTRLFEMVRYGSHRASEMQEQEAIACLTAIAAARRPDDGGLVESGR